MRIPKILALFLAWQALSPIGAHGAEGRPQLSAEEKRLGEKLLVHQERCSTEECRDQALRSAGEILARRRLIGAESMSDVTRQRLRQSCDQHVDDLKAFLECLTPRRNLSFEDGMRLAGYTKAGITSAGYIQLRIGMELDEVEYILGDYGEEVSYASSGGYSASIYQWKAGRRMIVVTFSDYKLSGRSQSGLYGY